jgi:hypothetical protein
MNDVKHSTTCSYGQKKKGLEARGQGSKLPKVTEPLNTQTRLKHPTAQLMAGSVACFKYGDLMMMPFSDAIYC